MWPNYSTTFIFYSFETTDNNIVTIVTITFLSDQFTSQSWFIERFTGSYNHTRTHHRQFVEGRNWIQFICQEEEEIKLLLEENLINPPF